MGPLRCGNYDELIAWLISTLVQNSRDCRADKSQIARSREIDPLQNVKQGLFFVSNFRILF